MATTSAGSERVSLKGGLTVSVQALQILWDLEGRGLQCWLDGGVLCIGPTDMITPDDRVTITDYRDELYALLAPNERVASA